MQYLSDLIRGQEKAVVGGAVAGALSLLAMVGVSGDMTVREVLQAAATWVVGHALVYLTTNRA